MIKKSHQYNRIDHTSPSGRSPISFARNMYSGISSARGNHSKVGLDVVTMLLFGVGPHKRVGG